MTKIISLSDQAYLQLARLKGKSSFSQAVLELTAPAKKPNLLAVIMKRGADTGLADGIETVYKSRGKASIRKVEL